MLSYWFLVYNSNILCGNFFENISDHLPNFIIIPNYKNSELKNKYNKRDYSKFNEELYLRDLMNENVLNIQVNITYFMNT